MAVDPLASSASSSDPQTFNRYIYALNNPLAFVDSDGEKPVYVFKDKGKGYKDWYFLDSGSKTYSSLKRRGYEDYKGPMGETIHSGGKYFQLTEDGFKAAVPTNGGEQEIDHGNINVVPNIAGAAFDSVVPFGQQIRDKIGFKIADESSTEYNNFSSAATIMQAPLVFKSLAKVGSMATAKALGDAGENAVGIIGPKVAIPSLTGTAARRFPDKLTATELIEVKNVGYLSLTAQIRDFSLYANGTRQFILYTRSNTKISRPLQNLIDNGSIIRRDIPH